MNRHSSWLHRALSLTLSPFQPSVRCHTGRHTESLGPRRDPRPLPPTPQACVGAGQLGRVTQGRGICWGTGRERQAEEHGSHGRVAGKGRADTKPCAGRLCSHRELGPAPGRITCGHAILQVSDGVFSTNAPHPPLCGGARVQVLTPRGWDVGSGRVPSPYSDRPKTRQGLNSWASRQAPRAQSACPAAGHRGSSVTATKRTVQGEGQKGGTGNGAYGQDPSGETPGTCRPDWAGRLEELPTWGLVVEPAHLHGVRGVGQQRVLQPN